MNLSKRLEKIINFIPKEGRIFDIGCDHGLVSVYLALQGRSIIAIDVHEKPLQKAILLSRQYEVEDKITFYLQNGISDISTFPQDTFILAGMGAYTILDILEKQNDGIFILQANNDLEYLRRKLHQKGFYITKEEAIYDKKWYVIMRWEKGKCDYKEEDFLIGPYAKYQKNYVLYLKDKYEKIYDKSKSIEIKKNLDIIKKAL